LYCKTESISTGYVTNLDLRGDMIIFELILTTFEASIIFEAAEVEVKMGSSLKPNRHKPIWPI